MKRYFINDGEKDVHITEWGALGKPVIFCMHGLGSTSLSFIEVAEQLKEEYRIISIDAPGHGKTPPFVEEESYEYPKMAYWLDQILDILRVERFYFLSHSWGSFVALYYLSQYNERVKGSILIDGGYQTKRRMNRTLEEEIAYYEKDFEEYVFESWHEFYESEKKAYSRWSPLLKIAVKDLGLEQDNKVIWHARGKTAKHIIKAMHKHETEDIYHRLPPDITILRATLPKESEEYRKINSELFKKKANGNLKIVENSTHMLHWDKPCTVVKLILKIWV
jgi:pimeloyl-ACP methyl ester carboxylesterase